MGCNNPQAREIWNRDRTAVARLNFGLFGKGDKWEVSIWGDRGEQFLKRKKPFSTEGQAATWATAELARRDAYLKKNPLVGKSGSKMSDYSTRAEEDRQAREYGEAMGRDAAFKGRPASKSLGIGTRGHVSPRSLKLFKQVYAASYAKTRAAMERAASSPASSAVNPDYKAYTKELLRGMLALPSQQVSDAQKKAITRELAKRAARDAGNEKGASNPRSRIARRGGAAGSGRIARRGGAAAARNPRGGEARARFEGLPAGFVLWKTEDSESIARGYAAGAKEKYPAWSVRVLKSGGKWRVFVKKRDVPKKENFLGFGGKKKKAASSPARKLRSRMSITEGAAAAYRAGEKSANAGLAGGWVDDHFGDRGASLVEKLERDYRRGAEASLEHRRKQRVQLEERERDRQAAAKEREEKSAKKVTALAPYKGVKLYKTGTGEVFTSADRDSLFDDVRQARRFIDSYTANPNLSGRRAARRPAGRRGSVRSSRNPEAAAAALYEKFHGAPADMVRLIIEQVHEHSKLAELADMVQIVVETPTGLLAELDFALDPPEKIVHLSASEDGKQLYFKGGDQEPNLKALGMDGDKWIRDHMELGRLAKFTYRTRKRMHEFKLVDYWHKPGEVTGLRPIVTYDYRNKSLGLAGGQYYVDAAGVIN